MPSPSADLLALALELEARGVGRRQLVTTLVRESHGSPSTLLGACGRAQSLARNLPFDPAARDAFDALVDSLRWVVRHPGSRQTV